MTAENDTKWFAQPGLWLGWALFLVGQSWLWNQYPNFIGASDSVHYLLMAEQLLQGQFWAWLSGHWSPLLSILLAPLMAAGVDGYQAFKVVNLCCGMGVIALLSVQLQALDFPKWWSLLIWPAVVPLLGAMTLLETPDLLLVFLLLAYLREFDQCSSANKSLKFCALLAGLVFWSKAIGLYLCLAHFGLWAFRQMVLKRWTLSQAARKFGQFFAIMMAVVFLYALPLSLKFERFTLGTSGQYNFSLIGTERQGQQLTRGELVDPNTKFTRWWAYEEPAEFVQHWSPSATPADRAHYLQHWRTNLHRLQYQFWIRDGLILLLLLVGLRLLRPGLWDRLPMDQLWSWGTIALLLPLAYSLVIIQSRYLWAFAILVLLIVLTMIRQLRSEGLKLFALVTILILYTINGLHERQLWVQQPQFFEQLVEAETAIPAKVLNGKRLAILDLPKSYYLMEGNTYLLWTQRFEFWGQFELSDFPDKALTELRNDSIDYFLIWEDRQYGDQLFPGTVPIFHDPVVDMAIYPLR
ncbi:MAG: hypothetical protein AAF598_00335 [Bacteroidota bacterium]